MIRRLAPILGLFFLVPAFSQDKEFTLDDIFASSKFNERGVRGFHWMENGRAYSALETDTSKKVTDIYRYDVSSGKRSKIVGGESLVLAPGDKPFAIQTYMFSPDGSKILFTGSLTARSLKTGGNFFLYDREKKTFRQITDTDREQMNIKFSPDGSMIGFVRANNIFIKNLRDGNETELTTDGADHVLNGHFDWVYEEEFGIIDGWQWSPDSKSIAFWRLDENRVPEFPIVNFLPLHQEITRQRYPKSGDPNSLVRIGVVTVQGKMTWIDTGSDSDAYIPRIAWTPGGKLMVERLNRHQNRLDVLLAEPATGTSSLLFSETEDTWVDVKTDYLFLEKTPAMIWSSERDGFEHLYLYDLKGKLIRQLTQGKWDVDRVLGVDEDDNTVFFTAAVTTPLERDLYSVKLDGTGFRRITRGNGIHSIDAPRGVRCFLDSYSDAATPPKRTLMKPDGTPIRVLDPGRISALADYALSPKSFFTFRTSDGVELNGWMLKPAKMDPSKKYPVLMTVYGGPGSQTVTNSWGGQGFLWDQLLAQKGYIVASVDNRGTGFRGKAFKSVTYKHLGTWETHDQIEGAKYLASLPFVDGSRIGITGGSYGGYMALMCILKGADVFKTSIAISSVTHWKFYDSIYTERYMLTPAENPDGYAETAPLTYADKLKGKLLLVHGTDDDNVHMQNSITMMDEFVKKNKQFETALYPGSKHGIRARLQFYTTMMNYILANL